MSMMPFYCRVVVCLPLRLILLLVAVVLQDRFPERLVVARVLLEDAANPADVRHLAPML